MDAARLMLAGVVIITALTLAVGAPTLSELDQDDEGTGSTGEGSPGDTEAAGGEQGVEVESPSERGETRDQLDPALLIVAGMLLALILGLTLLYGIGPVRILQVLLVVAVLFVVVMTVLSWMGSFDILPIAEDLFNLSEGGQGEDTGGGTDEAAGDGSDGGERGTDTSLAVSVVTLLLLFLTALAGVGMLYRYASRRDSDENGPEDSAPGGEKSIPTESLARSGNETPGVEDPPQENGIYRAWAEMTAMLDIENTHSRTPAEVEEIAVSAGMDRSRVAELTDLFRMVRYGGVTATDQQEQAAARHLERIEETFGQKMGGER
jgi:hypothetical protein